MDAIEKIISEIKQQGKQEVEAYVTSEQTRIDQEFQAAQQEILLKQEHEIEKRQQQLLKEFKQRQQRQTLEIRQDALNKKQAYLNQLFDEVVLKMSEWSAEEFQEFMKAQLGSLELTGKATILLGEYSQTKVLLFNGSFQRKLFQKKVALSLQKTVWIIIFSFQH